jgi:hypothetical protein
LLLFFVSLQKEFANATKTAFYYPGCSYSYRSKSA